jgi:hypothetical protein
MHTVPPASATSFVDYTAAAARGASYRARYGIDASVMFVLALCVGASAWMVHRTMDPRFFELPIGNDVWFEADLPTITDTMLHRWSDQSRNARHPLFPTLVTLPSYGFRTLGMTDRATVSLIVALGAAVWPAVFFLVARAATGRRLDAVIFTFLACVTSGTLFWLAVPETYVWSSLSVLAALALCAIDRKGRAGPGWYITSAAFCLAITVPNWIAGLLVAFARLPARRALQIAANSLSVVVVLWSVQRVAFPTAEFFIGYANNARFITPAASGGPGPVARALLFHSVVMPAIQVGNDPKWGRIMSVQRSSLGSSGRWGVAATVLWLPMLAFAMRGLFTSGADGGFRAVLAAALASQLGLFMIYGEETFLYSMHVAPLLVLAAALATRTAARRIVLGLALAVGVAAAVNNFLQFATAMTFFQSIGR